MFLIQAEKFRWALGHYPGYAERYMVHQQGIQGAIVSPPWPLVIFERLGFMRDSFAVLSHSLGASFLFIQLPPLRRVAAVEPQRCLQSRVKRSRRPPGERRLVRSARKDG
jgi:hypothetical protein